MAAIVPLLYVVSHILRTSVALPVLEMSATPRTVNDTAHVACAEFDAEKPNGSGWVLADCVHVWTSWAQSLPGHLEEDDRKTFYSVAAEIRRRGSTCGVVSPSCLDGVGSRTMRYLATWMYAEEIGCDWLGRPSLYSRDGEDGPYCHSYALLGAASEKRMERCTKIDWNAFFKLNDHMAAYPASGAAMAIDLRRDSSLTKAVAKFNEGGGFDAPPWRHWILETGNPTASRYFTRLQTWDAAKRQLAQRIVERFRKGFHEQPRSSWYDKSRDCSFTPSRVDVAIHVRLGDRRDMTLRDEYFDALENLMDMVSSATERQGREPPVFHIFSETSRPCPSLKRGGFDEFSRWPVDSDQIESCLNPEIPEDCPEKKSRGTCRPIRPGVFTVRDKRLYLHVGGNVKGDLSCMADADLIVMGCSTFGHVAGVLNKGVKLFSMACAGNLTGDHYKMMPPTAVAERGNLWVPVSGSWVNPSIYSERILEAALSQIWSKMS